jgi:hypothetical protein
MLGRETTSIPDSQMTRITSRAFANTDLGEEVHFSNAVPRSSTQKHNHIPGSHQPNQGENKAPNNISVSHRIILWPAVYTLMLSGSENPASDLHFLATIGSPWLLKKSALRHTKNLPCDEAVPCYRLQSGAVILSDLSVQQVDAYSAAYFNTFNKLFPLLDPDLFMDGAVARLLDQGYRDDDPESVLALLVFALGRLAHESILQDATQVGLNGNSEFRSGNITRPPELGFFNEARRRLGLIRARCCLENVQILLLEATYFEACARHSDFWISVSSACMSCMFLIQSRVTDWSSQYGDLVKRAFWVRLLHERSFNLEFGVATTGIEALADLVPMPHFPNLTHQHRHSGNPGSSGDLSEPDSYYAYHFSAMISLGRLMRRADDAIKRYEPFQKDYYQSYGNAADHGYDYTGDSFAPKTGYTRLRTQEEPIPPLIQELIAELDSWRNALPERLKWKDEDKFDYKRVDPLTKRSYPSFSSFLQSARPETIDLNMDIAVAHLRTCFYQARFLIHRPFVYKAFHHRSKVTATDRRLCAFAISAACLWPMSLSPPNSKQHLVPHLFSWTQNFLGLLLILEICQKDGYMREICQEGNITEDVFEVSISAMKAWLKDVSQVDGIAEWGLGLFL